MTESIENFMMMDMYIFNKKRLEKRRLPLLIAYTHVPIATPEFLCPHDLPGAGNVIVDPLLCHVRNLRVHCLEADPVHQRQSLRRSKRDIRHLSENHEAV